MTTQAATEAAVTTSEPKKLSPMEAFRKDAFAMEREFARALPPHIPVERFMRVVTTAVQTSMTNNFTNLLECDRRSLWQAAMRAAQDGLLPDGREGAILKYGDKAQWLPMVYGIRKKARNSGEISTWDAHCVFKNDHFVLRLGDSPSIDHTYDLATPRGDLIGAYSVALLKDGSKSYEVMSIDEIRAIRDRSQAWAAFKAGKIKMTPWSTDEAEMARKTVAKRHAKQLPSSADLDDLIRRDDELHEFKSDDGDGGNLAELPKRPRGKAALDRFADAGKVIEEVAATPATDNPMPEFTSADAYAMGSAARNRNDSLYSVPKDMTAEHADAWKEGWRDRDQEIAGGKPAIAEGAAA